MPLVVQEDTGGPLVSSALIKSINSCVLEQIISELLENIMSGTLVRAVPPNNLKQSSLNRYWGNKSTQAKMKTIVKSTQPRPSSTQPSPSSIKTNNKVRIQKKVPGNKSPKKLPSVLKAKIKDPPEYKANQAKLSLEEKKLQPSKTAERRQEDEVNTTVGNSFVICYWRLLTLIIGRIISVFRY